MMPIRPAARAAFRPMAKNKPCQDRDGAESCLPDSEMDYQDERDRQRRYRRKALVRTLEERERIARFNRELDVWLETLRR